MSSSVTRSFPRQIGRCAAGYVPRRTLCDVKSRQKPRQKWPAELYTEQMSCIISSSETLAELERLRFSSVGGDET
jgi:hypothetical protein